MTQREINLELVKLLGWAVEELRRSSSSHSWDDMVGLQSRISSLYKIVATDGQSTPVKEE